MKFYLFTTASFLFSLVSSAPVLKFSASGSFSSCPSSVASSSSLGNVGSDLNDAAIANGITPAYDTMILKTRFLRSDGSGEGDRKLAYCSYCYTCGCSPGYTCYVSGCYTCRRMLTEEDPEYDGKLDDEEEKAGTILLLRRP